MNLWIVVLLSAIVSVVIRLLPEIWLKGRAPPGPLARILPWLPVAVAGAFVGILHIGAESDVRLGYLIAAIPASLVLIWRRSFFLPILVGAVTLGLLRHFTSI